MSSPLNMFGRSPSSITCIRLTLTVNQPNQVIQCQRKALKQTPESEEDLPTLSEPWTFCGIKLSLSRWQLLKRHGDQVEDFKTMVTDATSNYTASRSIDACFAGSMLLMSSFLNFCFVLVCKNNPICAETVERQ